MLSNNAHTQALSLIVYAFSDQFRRPYQGDEMLVWLFFSFDIKKSPSADDTNLLLLTGQVSWCNFIAVAEWLLHSDVRLQQAVKVSNF